MAEHVPSETDPLSALKALAANVDSNFEAFQDRHSGHMHCEEGCSACCYTHLSVFPSEAARIKQWLEELPGADKEALLLKLQMRRQQDQKGLALPAPDAAGKVAPPCAFLMEGACLIYPARPIICRSQGAILTWISEEEDGSLVRSHDVCPLNFRDESSLPSPNEWLDLDRLTALQSLSEQNYQARRQSPGSTLLATVKTNDSNDREATRVSLLSIRDRILDESLPRD